MDENNTFFSTEAINEFPLLKMIVEASEKNDPIFLLRTLKYCATSIIIKTNKDLKRKKAVWEKKTEILQFRVSTDFKEELSKIGYLKGESASEIIREACDFYLDFLQNRIEIRVCDNKNHNPQ